MDITRKIKNRFWSKVNITQDGQCWNWNASINRSGYGQFWLDDKMRLAHRIAFAIYNNDLSIIYNTKNYHKCNNTFKCILHKCDNKKCCNPNHLFIGTNADNIKDKINKNRQQHMRGSSNGYSKLKENDILEIRKNYIPRKNGGMIFLAKKYNVSTTNICDIIKRKTWKHI
jgi:hypothetical protein